MKELSTEEKARAYDKAIEKIKYVMEHGVSPVLNKEDLQNIFPELKESEDEKIRKALLEMVHDTTGDELWIDYDVHKEDALAWLEKQGEQKPQRMVSAEAKEALYDKPKWGEEDESKVGDIMYFFNTAKTHYASTKAIDDCVTWLKSLKERMEENNE